MKQTNSLFTVLLVMLASIFGIGEAMAQKAYTEYDSETNTLTFYYDNDRSSRTGTTFSVVEGDYVPMWNKAYDGPSEEVTTVVFDSSFADARPTTTYEWFADMPNLTSIVGMAEYLNTEEVTTMDRMFKGCTSLTEIDLSGFNTEKVEVMYAMFQGCENVVVLDLESFNTLLLTDTKQMFNGCQALETIYINTINWDMTSVTTHDDMFRDCISLMGCRGTVFDDTKTDKSVAHLDYGTLNPGYLSIHPEPYALYDGTSSLTFYYDYDRATRMGTTYDLNEGATLPGWNGTCSYSINDVTFDDSFVNVRPTTTYAWFTDMPGLTSINNMQNLNTEEVTNMCTMFSGTSIPDLNLSSFNTENVVDMSGMFAYSSLSELDLTTFDTRNVIYMNEMFSGCSALSTIKVSKSWTMDNVENTNNMFLDCYTLAGANGTTYDEDNVDGTYARFDLGEDQPGYLTGSFEAYAVFSGGTLTFYYDMDRTDRKGVTFDLNPDASTSPAWSSFSYDVNKVVFDDSFVYARPAVTYNWFADMSNLTEIDGIEKLNTSEVTSMTTMFYNCSALTTIDVSGFDTRKVMGMHSMFRGSGVTSLDLSNFNTWNVALMGSMFRDCSNLETIYVDGNMWTATSATDNGDQMFSGCTSLVGGAGTVFDDSFTDATYAIIDEGEATPGYLTYKGIYAILDDAGTLTYYNDGMRDKREGKAYRVGGSIAPAWDTMSDHGYLSIKAAVVDPSMATARPTSTSCWFGSLGATKEIKGLEYLNTSEVIDMHYMFKGTVLEKIDLSGFDTRKVTDMYGMFYGNAELTSLDLTSFNTENVTNMEGMFEFCSKLENVDLSSFNTRKVTDISSMFRGCEAMKEVDLYNFETANVGRWGFMFRDCTELTTIYVSDGWEVTHNSFDDFMFDGCFNIVGGAGTVYDENYVEIQYARVDKGDTEPGYLTKKEAYAVFNNKTLTFYFDGQRLQREGTTYDLDAIGWYYDNNCMKVTTVVFDESFAAVRPTSTSRWCGDMTHLTEIKGIENLNTSEVIDMSGMFRNCEALTTLDLTTFDTHNVQYLSSMFYSENYSTLESVDLSSFNTENVMTANYMFYGCTELKTIYVGDNWNIDVAIGYGEDKGMFEDCTSLVGEKGTPFDAAFVDGTYAHIDEGEENPGYLTAKAKRNPADVNGDGKVNTADVVAVYTFVEKGSESGFIREACDVNGDGSVNTADVVAIYTAIIGGEGASSPAFNKQMFRLLTK